MGVLDEAIRDHLELKRRHGADPGEVALAERRALGPVGDMQGRDEADAQPQHEVEDFEDDSVHAEPERPGRHEAEHTSEETFAWDPVDFDDERHEDRERREGRAEPADLDEQQPSQPRGAHPHSAEAPGQEAQPAQSPYGQPHARAQAQEETAEIEMSELFGGGDETDAGGELDQEQAPDAAREDADSEEPRGRISRFRRPRRSAGRFPSGR